MKDFKSSDPIVQALFDAVHSSSHPLLLCSAYDKDKEQAFIMTRLKNGPRVEESIKLRDLSEVGLLEALLRLYLPPPSALYQPEQVDPCV